MVRNTTNPIKSDEGASAEGCIHALGTPPFAIQGGNQADEAPGTYVRRVTRWLTPSLYCELLKMHVSCDQFSSAFCVGPDVATSDSVNA